MSRTYTCACRAVRPERKIKVMTFLPSWWVWIPRLMAFLLPLGFLLIALMHKGSLSLHELHLLLLFSIPFSLTVSWGVNRFFVLVDKKIGEAFGCCENCGYHLHGASGPCPECGEQPATKK